MCLRFRDSLFVVRYALVAIALVACHHDTPLPTAHRQLPTHVLRVCSDPNNLPFSNAHLDGFENKIADLVARDLNASVEYTWWAQRRGFLRNTLKKGDCDVVIG